MRFARPFFYAAVFIIGAVAQAHAQSATPQQRVPAAPPQPPAQAAAPAPTPQQQAETAALIAEGSKIAKKGIGSTVPACDTCHLEGAGEFPVIYGQLGTYVGQQLLDFTSGKRRNAVMEPIAKALNRNQIAALAEYFSSQPRTRANQPVADEQLIAKGQKLATEGDPARELFPCERCHGVEGKGGDFAALAGQNPTYFLAQVLAFKESKRENDSLAFMQSTAKKLSEDEAKAIAAYYHQMAPAK